MLPSKVDWDVWRNVFVDQGLWRGPVEHVLNSHGLKAVSIATGFPGTSAAFAVLCASLETVVVKFYPPMEHDSFLAEVEVRSALEKHGSGVPFPHILFTGTLRDKIDWPYIIEEYKPGIATRDVWSDLSRADRDGLARQIAAILADLHHTPTDLLPRLSGVWGKWRERAARRAADCLEKLALTDMGAGKRLPKGLLEGLDDFLRTKAGDLLSSTSDSSLRLIHNDLTEDHALVERQREGAGPWRVTALLDYGDAKMGLLHEEWVVLGVGLFEQDAEAMRTFLYEYRLLTGTTGDADDMADRDSPAFRDRLLLSALLHRYNAEIIREALRRSDMDPSAIEKTGDLLNLLLPL